MEQAKNELGEIAESRETAFAGGQNGIWGLGLIWSVHETDSFFYSIR